jgi:flagellar protein FliO/FliZ
MLLDTLSQNATSAAKLNQGNSIAHFFTVLILFALVLAATYYTTKFVARTQEGKAKTGNLEVLETIVVAPGRFLQIVRIGSKYAAIGVGKEEITFLTELKEDDFTLPEEKSGSFAGILQKMKEKFPNTGGTEENGEDAKGEGTAEDGSSPEGGGSGESE